jgi:hypothetical protein
LKRFAKRDAKDRVYEKDSIPSPCKLKLCLLVSSNAYNKTSFKPVYPILIIIPGLEYFHLGLLNYYFKCFAHLADKFKQQFFLN